MENNKDASDNLLENQDLLDILSADLDEKSDLEKAMEEENKAIDNKMDELREIATILENNSDAENTGTGDMDLDLANWFNGNDKVPSSELSSYMGNATIKMDYGLTRQTLTNFDMMGSLRKFMDSSFDLLFDESSTMSLTPEELEDRTKLAFTMYKELAALNQRTVMSLKDYKLKSNSTGDDVDKISLLLSSIPSEKLRTLLNEISSK